MGAAHQLKGSTGQADSGHGDHDLSVLGMDGAGTADIRGAELATDRLCTNNSINVSSLMAAVGPAAGKGHTQPGRLVPSQGSLLLFLSI